MRRKEIFEKADMLDTYAKDKAELVDILTSLEAVACGGRVKATALDVRTKLESGVFSLAVVGQFKRGKTTFINALLGCDLLPTAIVPLTSIITVLRFGDEPRIEVFFGDGSRKVVPRDDLPLYVTERHNPRNEKGISRVEIAFPSPYLKNGVRIIDTPGVASVYEHNTKTTYEYLPQADAAVFLLSVDPPLTQAELRFLRDLQGRVSKVFFVLNKIDTADSREVQESSAFSKETIEKEAGFTDAEIIPLSARTALAGKLNGDRQQIEGSGLPAFERRLERFLLNEKGRTLINSIADKTAGLIDEETLMSEVEEKSLNLPPAELEAKIDDFRKFIRVIDQERLDVQRLLAAEIAALREDVLEPNLTKMKHDETARLLTHIDELARAHAADGNRKFGDALQKFIETEIRNTFAAWRTAEAAALKERLEAILGRFLERMNGLLNRVVRTASSAFGIRERRLQMKEALPPEIEFRFQTVDEADALTMTIGFVRSVLPKPIAHRLIHAEARARAAELVDRHCGKARYDFSERLNLLVRIFRDTAADTIEPVEQDVLRAMETCAALKRDAAAHAVVRGEEVRTRLETLRGLERKLKRLSY